MKPRTELPLPDHYAAAQAANFAYQPDQAALFDAASVARKAQAITPSGGDEFKTHLLLIDVQKDFCHREGSLFVAGRSGDGAIADSKRITEFIYRNLASLTDITTTLDTHFAFQIFSPTFWRDENGQAPAAHTVVDTETILSGRLTPNPAMSRWLCGGNYNWLRKQVEHYARELERGGKYQLYLWPPHCLLGSAGHALVGIVHEARLFHAYARTAQSWVEVKGGNPLTENYSVLRPEVLSRHDGGALAQRNTHFLNTLLDADVVAIAGQAASHCVKSSIDDLLDEILAAEPTLARKVHILTDCMSAVTVPDGRGGLAVDFSEAAEAALQRFADAGMHLVRSTDPLGSWPGFQGGKA